MKLLSAHSSSLVGQRLVLWWSRHPPLACYKLLPIQFRVKGGVMVLPSHGLDPTIGFSKLSNYQSMGLSLLHGCVVVLKPMLEPRKAHMYRQVLTETPSQMVVHPRRTAVPFADEVYRLDLSLPSPLLVLFVVAWWVVTIAPPFRQQCTLQCEDVELLVIRVDVNAVFGQEPHRFKEHRLRGSEEHKDTECYCRCYQPPLPSSSLGMEIVAGMVFHLCSNQKSTAVVELAREWQ